MDMKCRKCREPWDWWHIRDEVLEDQELYEEMEKSGGYVVDTIPELFSHGTDDPNKANWQFASGPYILQCPACMGKDIKLSEKEEFMSEAESVLADILGDDIDGMMAEMEDLESLLGE